jgi:hypothetical protein
MAIPFAGTDEERGRFGVVVSKHGWVQVCTKAFSSSARSQGMWPWASSLCEIVFYIFYMCLPGFLSLHGYC